MNINGGKCKEMCKYARLLMCVLTRQQVNSSGVIKTYQGGARYEGTAIFQNVVSNELREGDTVVHT